MQQAIKEFLKRPIAYQPVTAKAFGSVKLAVLWCQLYYWSDKGHDPDGWIYKTRTDIYDETGLSRKEQETARKLGSALGVIEEKRMGETGIMHFRVNIEKAYNVVQGHLLKQKTQTLFGAADHIAATGKKVEKTEKCTCFEDFWKEYPRKENKKKAESVWGKIKHEDHHGIIGDVKARKARHSQWIEGFVPHATTYINGERWKDEIVSNSKGKPTKGQDSYERARERRYRDTDEEIKKANQNVRSGNGESIGDILKKHRPNFLKK